MTEEQKPQRSTLVATGFLLCLLGCLLPTGVGRIAGETPNGILLVLMDVFRLFIFIGIGMMIIGYIRSRKQKQ